MNKIPKIGVRRDISNLLYPNSLPDKDEDIIQWIEQCSGNIIRAMIVRLKIVKEQAKEPAHKKTLSIF